MSAVVEYFIVVLAVRSYVSVYPLVCMSVIEIIFSIIWTMLVRNLYQKLYPPRRMLVIYGNYPPDDLIAKINSRKDKYNICMSVSYKVGYVKLYTMAKEYEAVVLCDLPAEARNQIMKYCYQESIRTYVTPKSQIFFLVRQMIFICLIHRYCCFAMRDLRSIRDSLKGLKILCFL